MIVLVQLSEKWMRIVLILYRQRFEVRLDRIRCSFSQLGVKHFRVVADAIEVNIVVSWNYKN